MKRHQTLFLLLVLLCVVGIGSWMLSPWDALEKKWGARQQEVVIDRYDRVLDEYVSLNSYTALGRMNTQYPMETKLLIEDVLKLGPVNDPNAEQRLRHYYLDSTVQVLLDEVHRQYGDMSDIEADFSRAFEELKQKDPDFRVPHVYTQVSCLNQSIVVGDTLIGISLDMYLGADFPLYADFYTPEQRAQMNRESIVRDAINAYMQFLGN